MVVYSGTPPAERGEGLSLPTLSLPALCIQNNFLFNNVIKDITSRQ
jgi:hypothetical protein